MLFGYSMLLCCDFNFVLLILDKQKKIKACLQISKLISRYFSFNCRFSFVCWPSWHAHLPASLAVVAGIVETLAGAQVEAAVGGQAQVKIAIFI